MKMVKALIETDPRVSAKVSDLHSIATDTKKYPRLKILFYFSGLILIGVFFNSCFAGYVASEPQYVEVVRPVSPGNSYVWTDGGWDYNRRSQVYVQREGYWQQPVQNRTYVQGHWESTPRGKTWSKGYYQKQSRQGNLRRRY